jgi:very-short-patch-repair endonuclease
MRFIFNNPKFKLTRSDLRKQMTEAESLLWSKIKNKQLVNYKFRRQYGIGPFIVDFYCPKLKLVIEIDGGQHNKLENIEYDNSRTEYFKSMNIIVIRYWNNEVLSSIEGVYDDILNKIRSREKDIFYIIKIK